MIKQTKMADFEPWRTYKSRPTSCMKLKSDQDEITNVYLTNDQDLLMFSSLAIAVLAYAIHYMKYQSWVVKRLELNQ